VAFIGASGEARWLLPDDRHVIVEHPIPGEERYPMLSQPKAPVAIAALVKAATGEDGQGALLLYDAKGQNIQAVADHVLDVHGVSLSEAQGITVLYEKPGRYVMASFDPSSLAKRGEEVVTFPNLR
jgi:hypothetical protein